MAKKKTVSKTSPKGGKRGCLCDNGTYDSKCCDGTLRAQGIGSSISDTMNNIVRVNETRVIVSD
jgi:hypothetical protein